MSGPGQTRNWFGNLAPEHLSSRLQLACQSPGSQGLTTPSESSQDVAAPGSQVIRGLISPSDPLQGSKKLTKHFFTHCQSNDLKVQQMSGMVKFSYMPFELQVNVKLHSVHVLKHPCVRVCFVILYFRLSGAFNAPPTLSHMSLEEATAFVFLHFFVYLYSFVIFNFHILCSVARNLQHPAEAAFVFLCVFLYVSWVCSLFFGCILCMSVFSYSVHCGS